MLSTYRDVSIIDKSLSGHCHITGTCAKDLAVIGIYDDEYCIHDYLCLTTYLVCFSMSLPDSAHRYL